jgi:hypothetical protein
MAILFQFLLLKKAKKNYTISIKKEAADPSLFGKRLGSYGLLYGLVPIFFERRYNEDRKYSSFQANPHSAIRSISPHYFWVDRECLLFRAFIEERPWD